MFKSAIHGRLKKYSKGFIGSSSGGSPAEPPLLPAQQHLQNKRPLTLNPNATTKSFKFQKSSKDD